MTLSSTHPPAPALKKRGGVTGEIKKFHLKLFVITSKRSQVPGSKFPDAVLLSPLTIGLPQNRK
jgi:hypothetical protein